MCSCRRCEEQRHAGHVLCFPDASWPCSSASAGIYNRGDNKPEGCPAANASSPTVFSPNAVILLGKKLKRVRKNRDRWPKDIYPGRMAFTLRIRWKSISGVVDPPAARTYVIWLGPNLTASCVVKWFTKENQGRVGNEKAISTSCLARLV
jgi:hypothetical protein